MGAFVGLAGKALKAVLKIALFCGLAWFLIPFGVWLATELITGKYLEQVPVMNTVCNILWYMCYGFAPLTLIQNIIRVIKKDQSFSWIRLIMNRKEQKGFEAKLGGDAVALKTAKDLSGVVFGKQGGKYATMPETTDGHVLIVGGAGSGKTAAVAIPTLMSWKERVFAIDIKGELYAKTKKARGEAQIKVFNPTDTTAYGYDPFYMLKNADDISSAARQLAMSIVPLPADVKDPFWIKGAQNMLCENAPKEYQDRQTLWNAVEQIEKSSKAQLAREYEVALPVELSREEQIKLVRDFAKENFVDNGMCVDFSIHDKEDGNPHAHIMLTTRPIEQDNSWEVKQRKEYILDKKGQKQYDKKKQTYKCKTVKTTNWDSKEFLQRSRESWAEKVNQELEKKSLPQRVDHRSFKEQGIEKIPTQHIGVSANAMEKRGIESQRGNENREIKKANGQIQTIEILEKQTQKEIAFIREDISWNRHHEEIAKIEEQIPKAAGNEKVLLSVQAGLLKLYDKAKLIEPTKTSEGRTIEIDGRKVPYFEYHKNKLVGDISFAQDKVKGYLDMLAQQRQEAPQEQGGFAARREVFKQQEAPQEKLKIDTAYVERMAQQLATVRNEFVRETVNSHERTRYQPNPIYARQANEIESVAKTVAEQSRTIEAFKAERDKLGMFKGKEKKEIQGKIDNFERLRRSNLDKLKALGVSNLSKADEAAKEKRTLAAQEQEKAQAARRNEGAGSRAEEAKQVFLEAAKRIPADQRQAVLERMEQYNSHEAGGMEVFKAEIEARRVLDSALKEQTQDREHEKTKVKGRGRTD